MPEYTADWTTPFVPLWMPGLERFVGRQYARGVEVGCFEGRSSAWFLENVLTGVGAFLTCVDPGPQPSFRSNMAKHDGRYSLVELPSYVALPALPRESFDFVYIDACPKAACTLRDGVLAFELLKVGGCLIFDGPRNYAPRVAGINAMLSAYSEVCEVLCRDRQTVLIKTKGGCSCVVL